MTPSEYQENLLQQIQQISKQRKTCKDFSDEYYALLKKENALSQEYVKITADYEYVAPLRRRLENAEKFKEALLMSDWLVEPLTDEDWDMIDKIDQEIENLKHKLSPYEDTVSWEQPNEVPQEAADHIEKNTFSNSVLGGVLRLSAGFFICLIVCFLLFGDIVGVFVFLPVVSVVSIGICAKEFANTGETLFAGLLIVFVGCLIAVLVAISYARFS